jgi:hypothetical protein
VQKTLIVAAGLLYSVAVPVLAQQCAVAYPQQQECWGQGGCHSSVTTYFCFGYGNGYTCGMPCTGAISCCGHVYGYIPVTCNSICAGCKKSSKPVAELLEPQVSGSSLVAVASACAAKAPSPQWAARELGPQTQPDVAVGGLKVVPDVAATAPQSGSEVAKGPRKPVAAIASDTGGATRE